jgi:hypothetical protein
VSGLVPAGLVTATCTDPPAWAGAVATSRVTPLVSVRVNEAVVPPKVTLVALASPLPMIVTEVPALPLAAESWVTCGFGVIEVSGPLIPLTV